MLTNLPDGAAESSSCAVLEPSVTRRAKILLTLAALAALTISAAAQEPARESAKVQLLVVAATTSVEDSGLFDHLLPRFTAATGITVRVVSRASAAALMTAEKGTIDAVIVNDADALDSFVAAGQGTRRQRFMFNRFVIVGPPSDPAGVRGMNDASAALREIARKRATFVSRGDNSGTHTAELKLWQAADVNPKTRSGNWYRETGLGMGLTVQMAGRLDGYTLTDRATWVKAADPAASTILVDGDPRLFNPYEVILVNPAQHPHVNVAAATAFLDWLVSPEGREAIGDYRVNGEKVFEPSPDQTN
jgi:tungstate transport system substrate-binding protein